MRVLFIEVETERGGGLASFGPSFVGAYLRSHGHDVHFMRVPIEMDAPAAVQAIARIDPQLIGVSLTTRQWQRARHLVAEIRQVLDIPVASGGLHPTFSAEEVLANPGFDYVCIGEGEQAALGLVNAIENGLPTDKLPNIWVKQGPRPPLLPPLPDLNEIPFVARDLLNEPDGVVHMSTQRGCPFPCTYCGARKFADLYAGGYTDYGRRRSIDNVMRELREYREKSPLYYVIFLDDTFTINHGWVREFCTAYRDEFKVPFWIHVRVETVNERMLHELAEAGCLNITYGVESGSERIRREIMKRPVKNKRFLDVFRWTKEAGIMVTANYMLGLPEETRDDLEQTLELAEQLDAYDFGYFVFYPYPGTHLFTYCQDKGYLPTNYLEREANHRESILTLPTLSQADIGEYYDRFTALRARSFAARARVVAGGELPADWEEASNDHVHAFAKAG